MKIAGAADRDAADNLLELFERLTMASLTASDRRNIIVWLQGLYDGPDLLNALRPDRVGEWLIQEVLEHLGHDDTPLLTGALNLPGHLLSTARRSRRGRGRSNQARDLYQQSLDIAAQLAQAEPGNTTYQRDLSILTSG